MPSSAVQKGATGPITLADMVALAEGLSCLVSAQLQNPGCPVALAANFTILDISTSLISLGTSSISTAFGLHTEIAQFYGIPRNDAYASIESTFHLLPRPRAAGSTSSTMWAILILACPVLLNNF